MPRIGIIVDGEGEYYALPVLLKKMKGCFPLVANPLHCDIQPCAKDLGQQAMRVAATAKILIASGAEMIILLLDKENRRGCAQTLADKLTTAVNKEFLRLNLIVQVVTVLKVRKFENWLVADWKALAAQSNLVRVHKIRQQADSNKADAIKDAFELLKEHSIDKAYAKRRGALEICRKADPLVLAKNSRSFRKFLRTIGHPRYRDQSARPR
jgi:hypothetical protein